MSRLWRHLGTRRFANPNQKNQVLTFEQVFAIAVKPSPCDCKQNNQNYHPLRISTALLRANIARKISNAWHEALVNATAQRPRTTWLLLRFIPLLLLRPLLSLLRGTCAVAGAIAVVAAVVPIAVAVAVVVPTAVAVAPE
jgi:hypothetical protein